MQMTGGGASQLGQSGGMGIHAQAGGAAGNLPNFEDNQPRRFGIGKVGSQLCPGEGLTQGELADVLNTFSSTIKIVCP